MPGSRFGGGAGASGAPPRQRAAPDVHEGPLAKLVDGLSSKTDAVRARASQELRQFVALQSRELSTEQFATLLSRLTPRLYALVQSSENHHKLGGIAAIDALIDVSTDEQDVKIIRFANYLRMFFSQQPNADPATLEKAAEALGHLARAGGTLTADFVDFEVKRALEWLQGERGEHRNQRRLAACLVLRELARNAPTNFYVNVAAFFEVIWGAVRDPKVVIRQAATDALHECLALIADRRTRHAVQWHCRVFAEVQRGFGKGQVEAIHGSLLVIGELLEATGDFMVPRFREICDTVLSYREHRDRLIKRTVSQLLPQLAAFCPEVFVRNYLDASLNHLLSSVRHSSERATAFKSLGVMALAVGRHIVPRLPAIVQLAQEGLAGKRKRDTCPEALTLVLNLSQALGPAIAAYFDDLLEPMFANGLSPELISALTALSDVLPGHVLRIQERLMQELSAVLTGHTYVAPGQPKAEKREAQRHHHHHDDDEPHHHDEQAPAAAATLALHTLGTFDLSSLPLLPFVRDCVTPYLDHSVAAVRAEAVLTCSRLLRPPPMRRGPSAAAVSLVLQRLLVVGIADPDTGTRRAVVDALDDRFDAFMCQAANLRQLLILLNDEAFEIRETAIQLIGRLAPRNPAAVIPSLRKHLIQLMAELKYASDPRTMEEGAALLGHLVRSCDQLVSPYLEPVLEVLLPKLADGGPGLAAAVLVTLGELCEVAGAEIVPYEGQLLPLIINTLLTSSVRKRVAALRTLGQLVGTTGAVIQPYYQYASLLELTLGVLEGGGNAPWALRREVLKTFGILGALDPYKHRLILTEAAPEANEKQLAAAAAAETQANLTPSSEHYYPTVAITALMKILRDSSLSVHHNSVVTAVMFIFKSLGLKCVPFLAQIMPPLFHVLHHCEHGLRESLFQQLRELVSIVKQHLRPFLGDVFELIELFWDKNLEQLLSLLEELSLALSDEVRACMPQLAPLLVAVLQGGARQPTLKVLRTLEVLGSATEEFLFVLVPALLRVLEQPETPTDVQVAVIRAVARLGAMALPLAEHASRIVHALTRQLQQGPEALHEPVMDALCAIITQLPGEFAVFAPRLRGVMARRRISHARYEALVAAAQRGEPLPPLAPPPGRAAAASSQPGAAAGGASGGAGAGAGKPTQGGMMMDDSAVPGAEPKKAHVSQQNLRRAWETSQRSTKEDWDEWMRRFSVELLRESPSVSLRSCSALAQVYHPLARELFNAAFVSCWTELYDQYQDQLVHALETAFRSDSISPEILQTLLNLAEFMEHDVEALPVDIRQLADLATKCHAYAKALHYKELEFQTSPASCVESLISINNQLGLPEAAVGILKYAQQHHSHVIDVKASWFEKLQDWQGALERYRRGGAPASDTTVVGQMRCYDALGEYEQVLALASDVWPRLDAESVVRHNVAIVACRAAWALSRWDDMQTFLQATNPEHEHGSFFRAIEAVHAGEFDRALFYVDATRRHLDTTLSALVGESYDRSYKVIVRVQQLAEMEEIVQYKRLCQDHSRIKEAADFRKHLMRMWRDRLAGCKREVGVWRRLLSVRTLILAPREDLDTWLEFATLCRQSGDMAMSHKTLTQVLSSHDPLAPLERPTLTYGVAEHHRVAFAYLKHLWVAGEREHALRHLRLLERELVPEQETHLHVRCFLKMGEWELALHEDELDEHVVVSVLNSFHRATQLDSTSYKAWHAWALMNFNVVEQSGLARRALSTYAHHIAPAVRGFFHSISLGRSRFAARIQQDTLRLLTLWFSHGHRADVYEALLDGFDSVSIDTWLRVVPQLIARIHTPHPSINELLQRLLARVGQEHPQALIYPLSVALNSPMEQRRRSAEAIMTQMRQHAGSQDLMETLMEQALMVSAELSRVAILWHEMWHNALDEASRLYYHEKDVEGMLEKIKPLHQLMRRGPETLRERSFHQMFGDELRNAEGHIQEYERTRVQASLSRAWEIYYHVFRRLNKQLPQLTSLDLRYVSPVLLEARDLALAVPGTYRAGAPVVTVASFVALIQVITSKQRPRKFSVVGSDGRDHAFLLKGHEDLRQDERVMQLFGLVNALLAHDRTTCKNDLAITHYSVTPLSHTTGIVGWVPNCDTLHHLVKEFREARKILLNIEQRLILQMAPDNDKLTYIQKVEVFKNALEKTTGQDLYKVLWLKSVNSEVWLDRRTNYTRSLAVMSMVGYVLGLGDRHPSNLMLDRLSGRVVHIDFGDCFEVAMHREKFPEKVPFRLTRMLVNAMEVSGIEGSFRSTCEAVMAVLRDNRDSLMAMLEAFVHDPLIFWRLLHKGSSVHPGAPGPGGGGVLSAALSGAPGGGEGGEGDEEEDDEDVGGPPPAPVLEAVAEDDPGAPPPPPAGSEEGEEEEQAATGASPGRPRTVTASSLVTATADIDGGVLETKDGDGDGEGEGQGDGETEDDIHMQIQSLAASVSVVDRDMPVQESVSSHRPRFVHALGPEGATAPGGERLNERALDVIRRVQSKLTGRDFDGVAAPLDVPQQVNRLIEQATSFENLSRSYAGWCAWW